MVSQSSEGIFILFQEIKNKEKLKTANRNHWSQHIHCRIILANSWLSIVCLLWYSIIYTAVTQYKWSNFCLIIDFSITCSWFYLFATLYTGSCDHDTTNDAFFTWRVFVPPALKHQHHKNWNQSELTSLSISVLLSRWPRSRGVVAVECVFSHVRARLASEDTVMCFFPLWDTMQRRPEGNTHVQQHRFLSRWTWDHRLRCVYRTVRRLTEFRIQWHWLVSTNFSQQNKWSSVFYLCFIDA